MSRGKGTARHGWRIRRCALLTPREGTQSLFGQNLAGYSIPGYTGEGNMLTRHRLQTWSGLVMRIGYLSLLLPAVSLAADRNTIDLAAPRQPARADDSFTRMFPGLPPFAPATDEVRETAKRNWVKRMVPLMRRISCPIPFNQS